MTSSNDSLVDSPSLLSSNDEQPHAPQDEATASASALPTPRVPRSFAPLMQDARRVDAAAESTKRPAEVSLEDLRHQTGDAMQSDAEVGGESAGISQPNVEAHDAIGFDARRVDCNCSGREQGCPQAPSSANFPTHWLSSPLLTAAEASSCTSMADSFPMLNFLSSSTTFEQLKGQLHSVLTRAVQPNCHVKGSLAQQW